MATVQVTVARVYVGTYYQYNCGNLYGAWFDVCDYEDYREFILAVLEYHKQEDDPELMAQDFEGLGDVSEYGAFDRIRMIYLWMAQGFDPTDEKQAAAFFAYLDNRSSIEGEDSFEKFQENFIGWYPSLEDYCWEYLEETGEFAQIPEHLSRYFDMESYARDFDLNGEVWTFESWGEVALFRSC